MSETQKNIPSPDISDVLTTYKSHPTTEGDDAAQSLLKNRQEITLDKDSGWSAPKSETPFEKKMYILHEGTKMFEIMVNGFVKMAKIGAWCIALFGCLFVALLATNTMDQATDIYNKSIFSKWWESDDIAENTAKTEMSSTPLKSSVLDIAPSETPEIIAKKRAALLEARKTARLQQEKLKATAGDLTQ